MRVRVLLTATLALVALVALPGYASAQAGEPTPEGEECIHILEEGGEVDECQESPSLILPATSELVWGSISFVVLLAALYKFAWPGLTKGMADRSERIRSDLDQAEQAKVTAQRALDDYRTQLNEAKGEAGKIIEEARRSADAMRQELQSKAEADIAELRKRAAAEVEAAKSQALTDLRNEVATLAIGAAEVVVQHSLDRDTQLQLIENYINEVAAASNGGDRS